MIQRFPFRFLNVVRNFRTLSSPSLRQLGIPVLLIVLGIPLFVHGQMGGAGVGGAGGLGGAGNVQLGVGGAGPAGGGMGGMGGSPALIERNEMLSELAKNPVVFKRPTGEVPLWLKSARTACESTETLRAKLNENFEANFNEAPLEGLVHEMSDSLNIQIDVNSVELADEGLTLDSIKVSIRGIGPAREILRRALEPLQLAYIVHETTIEITSQREATDNPALIFYDLGFVQEDSSKIPAIVHTIEESIEPDSWLVNGGSSSISVIGQQLVVSATEKAHSGIEKLLFRLGYPIELAKPAKPAAKAAASSKVYEAELVEKDPFNTETPNIDPIK